MALLLVNNEDLLHFQNFEESQFWMDMHGECREGTIIIAEDQDEVEEIEAFFENTITVIPK